MNTCRKAGGRGASWFIPFFLSAMLSFACSTFLGAHLASGLPASSAPTARELSPSPQSPGSEPSSPSLDHARSLFEQGTVFLAERSIRQFLHEHPDSAEAHYLLGHILFREIQAQASVEKDRPPPQESIDGITILGTNSADSTTREAKAKASLAEFTAGAKIHTPSASDLKTVALDYVLLGDYPDADKWLTKMLEWTPNDSEGWYLLGRAKYNENRFAEAISAFQKSLTLAPADAKTEDNLGLSFAGLGRNEEAADAYKKAVAWQERSLQKDPGPYIDMGSLLLDQSKNEEAIPYLRRAVEISSTYYKAHELLGQAHSRLNQLPLAQSELEKAISLAPNTASLHCMLGPVYRKQGFSEKAKSEFELCSSLNDTHTTPLVSHP